MHHHSFACSIYNNVLVLLLLAENMTSTKQESEQPVISISDIYNWIDIHNLKQKQN